MTEQRFYRFERAEQHVHLCVVNVSIPGYFSTIDEALNSFIDLMEERWSNALSLASSYEKNIIKAKDLVKAHKEAEVMQLPKILYGVQDGLWLTKYGIEWLELGVVSVMAGGVLHDVVHLNTDSSVIEQLAIRGYVDTPELAIERAKARIDRELTRFKERNHAYLA